LWNKAQIPQALRGANTAEQTQNLSVQPHVAVPAQDQLRYLQMELFETESATEGDTETNQDALSHEDQVRQLRMRLPDSLKALEWSELLKAASIDENLVHQLAKGGRRTAGDIDGHKPNQRSHTVQHGLEQNMVLELEGKAPQPGS
jgi:hypothetical protein